MNPLARHGMSDEAFQALWERSLTCPYLHAFYAATRVSGRPIADIAVEVLLALSNANERAMAASSLRDGCGGRRGTR